MKKFGLFIFAAFAILALPSCNESNADLPAFSSFATVHPISGSDYYFTFDSGKKVYPSDKTRIGAYEAEEGQRVVIYFNLLDNKLEGYDYNAQLYAINDIYTSSAKVVTTADDLAKFKDDRIHFEAARLSKAYLSVQVAYVVTTNSKHKFDLICNETKSDSTPTNEGYLDVELRHDAGDDNVGQTRGFYLSFDLVALQSRLEGKKGVTLRVQSPSNGVQTYKIDFEQEKM